MKNLKTLFNNFFKKIPEWSVIAFLIFSFIGFLDATYLTIEHFNNSIPPCSIVSGCELVLTSKFATIFNIPVALLGAIYYLTIFTLTFYYLDSKKKRVLFFAAKLTPIGIIASVYFVYLQIAIINSICLYCMSSALTSTLLFILGMYILKFKKN